MTTPPHARRPFHEDLDALQGRLLAMAGLVEKLVGKAAECVLQRNPAVASEIVTADDRVDAFEIEIDELVTELTALHQPMAIDLRRLITTLRLSSDLERVGDHAVNIAKAELRMAEGDPMPEFRELTEMFDIALGMFSDVLAAYVSRNSEIARRVCLTDDKVDDLRRSLFQMLVTHMEADPKRVPGALELLLVGQNLERIADLSTNIAEDVVFLVEGRSIKHGAEGHHGAEHEQRADPVAE